MNELMHQHHGWQNPNRIAMKGEIIFHNRTGGEIIFKITSEHLWERLYHELAFLAESGRGVSYVPGSEK